MAHNFGTAMVTSFRPTDQSGIEPRGHSSHKGTVPRISITLVPAPITLMSDPRVTAIPRADCCKPILDLGRGASAMADVPGGAIHLFGGRMTGGVVRVGDSVRRPTSASSAFVAALLAIFEQREFHGAPRYLGQADGMDSLSFIPGEVPANFRHWEDNQVAAAGALLRAMHDATRDSELAGRSPVVCHHDASPSNCVFVDGVPTAWIDFDTAAPGSPLEDLGYALWTWCIASKCTVPVERQAEQVKILADAYGIQRPERGAVVDAILERQARNARFWTELMASPENAPATPDVLASRVEWSRRELAFTAQHRSVFETALA
ncbi:phosphotransferase family protein [Streptomyces parvulus]|uniref:phosphotransferase family protein n=1 Tax=Streptomyces parvulus TaxID=146923 RepID=UPI0037991D00